MELFAIPDDGEGIAANPVAGGFNHRQRHRGGDSRINGVAAQLQHLHPRLRRQRLRGGNRVMAHHRRAS